MNNFLFENKTKVYFGKGGVKEYLGCLLEHYGRYRDAGLRRRFYQAQWCL